MNNYEILLNRSPVSVKETDILPEQFKGLYAEVLGKKVILIKDRLCTLEKFCVLAEEIGHYHTTAGNITDQSKLVNRKHEKRARSWAHEELIPLTEIISAHKANVRNRYELADFLGVTEGFLGEAIERYVEKYGVCTQVDGFTICFEPLGVIDWIEF
ncbi:protein of unknown function [Amphibacillus marinus]|uniref:IrrE N-terminal-like domain-containing protein n=1 Tax=Amphibacillus marinus TaxID=872970 RepID=A0A1H8IZL9_9BACI|nr:ImmA/IrrE family metallo-endopeptidase [Amphibacillus marinus]SEN73881.1 protein of unknown function [Amphibacillus marinus]